MARQACLPLRLIIVADELISSGEAARLIGISRRSLSRYAADGLLRPAAVLPGRGRSTYRWSRDDLLAQWAELQRQRER